MGSGRQDSHASQPGQWLPAVPAGRLGQVPRQDRTAGERSPIQEAALNHAGIQNADPSMENLFFEQPILNSPYDAPTRHWELDKDGQPTQRIIESRRRAEFVAPAVREAGNGQDRGEGD